MNYRPLITLLLFLFAAGLASAEITPADRALVQTVTDRLCAVATPSAEYSWPPVMEIVDDNTINAYATVVARQAKGEKPAAQMVVHHGLLAQVIKGDADRLAFVLGHELAHLVLRHTAANPAQQATPFLRATFSRGQELEADGKGMEFALAAGYSFQRGLAAIKCLQGLGLDYSSFEGLGVDHPSWKERLALLDEKQAVLWQSMSAFENGTIFLLTEQYPPAERCFRRVVKEFPSCYEAWSNLGYALLMQYCDALEVDDLKRFAIGHIVCGGFYRRPPSLETLVRGINEEVWWDAVGALREAVRLQPNAVLPKANLGLAYLVSPAGSDTRQATRFLCEAAAGAQADTTLPAETLMAILTNASVAELAGGAARDSEVHLAKAEDAQQRLFAGTMRRVSLQTLIRPALLYNRALFDAKKGGAEGSARAIKSFERYLKIANPSSAWWSLGYEQYAALCRGQQIEPNARAKFLQDANQSLRPLIGVTLPSGKTLILTDSVKEIAREFGAAQETPVVAGTNLHRLRYPAQGIELLATESVLAIRLTGVGAPPIEVRGTGVGTKAYTLRVGMTKTQFEEIVGDVEYDFRQLTDPDINYRFYRSLGLAVRLVNGAVHELVIVQIPDRGIFED
ncbi:MAG TPA: M48 family metallopeptidase [Armatimonadota bacterium]